MAQVEGFGEWKIIEKDGGINCESYGIIDIKKMLVFETDSNQNPTGNVLNLNHFGGWELILEREY